MSQETFIPVGRSSFFMRQAGQEKPVVILEAGAGEDSTTWKDILPAVAQFSQVMAYDRAGLGYSAGLPTPRTALHLVNNLHDLLQASQLEGPYLLVGHSLGALLCRLYTQQYRQEVAGLLLLDGPHPDQGKRFTTALTQSGWQEHELVQPILHMAAGVAPEEHPEGLDFAKSLAQVDPMQTFSDLPLVVISNGKSHAEVMPDLPMQAALAFDGAWDAMQSELAKLSTRGVHLRAKRSGHYIHCDEPALVVGTIHQLVRTIRHRSFQK
ncbi:MAG TPA: alpha/beta hydrolase [Ktedonobacteraceae bacterium]|nr:alpha/beta hydrolase [Ktedonobacteraceae bacterium]